MYTQNTLDNRGNNWASGLTVNLSSSRKFLIGILLVIALLAFEIFNFDTTRYALESLLGDVSFMGLGWAAVLAVAFCAIDFAGLARLFTPEQGGEEPRAVWYLMGAWLLGATMNAIMTWWAVNLTLLNHDLGNEVLSRQQLLQYVPIFVAVLVWLTRILFIGAFSIAGEHLFQSSSRRVRVQPSKSKQNSRRQRKNTPKPKPASRPKSRIRRQSPIPGNSRPVPVGLQAHNRDIMS